MEKVELNEDGKSLSVKMKIRAEITKEKSGMYFSNCPSLDVWSQGETYQEAKKNLLESMQLLMEVSVERGTFDKWRKKFDKINKKAAAQASPRKAIKAPPPNTRVVNIPANFLLAA